MIAKIISPPTSLYTVVPWMEPMATVKGEELFCNILSLAIPQIPHSQGVSVDTDSTKTMRSLSCYSCTIYRLPSGPRPRPAYLNNSPS